MFSQEQTTDASLRRGTTISPTEWKAESCHCPSVSVQIFPGWLLVHSSNPCRPRQYWGQFEALLAGLCLRGSLLPPSPNVQLKISWITESWKSQPVPDFSTDGDDGHILYSGCSCLSYLLVGHIEGFDQSLMLWNPSQKSTYVSSLLGYDFIYKCNTYDRSQPKQHAFMIKYHIF